MHFATFAALVLAVSTAFAWVGPSIFVLQTTYARPLGPQSTEGMSISIGAQLKYEESISVVGSF